MMAEQERPVVRAAVVALDAFGAFGANSAREARTLLGMWARRAELSDADVAAVIACYEGRAQAAGWPAGGQSETWPAAPTLAWQPERLVEPAPLVDPALRDRPVVES